MDMDFDLAIKRELLQEQIEMLKDYINTRDLPYLLEDSEQWNIFEMLVRKKTTKDSIDKEDREGFYEELENMIKSIELTAEEKAYLAYNKYRRHFNVSDKKAEWDIVLRRKLIEIIGNGSIENAIETLKKDHFEYPKDIKFAIDLINANNWETKAELKELVRKNVEYFFNMRMNCGGYALEVETCLFGGAYKNADSSEYLERNVSMLLDLFPFIRLLGDTKLCDDEYLVEYRASSNGGHHFIKIESDGTIKDKNESKPPRVIEDLSDEDKIWGKILKNCSSAVFAVKNNHDIHTKRYSYMINDGHVFEEVTLNNLNAGINEFEYHNHQYTIIDNGQGDKYVYSNGEIVATIISDETGTIVVEEEDKKDYISNTKSTTYKEYAKQLESMDRKKEQISDEEMDLEFEL